MDDMEYRRAFNQTRQEMMEVCIKHRDGTHRVMLITALVCMVLSFQCGVNISQHSWGPAIACCLLVLVGVAIFQVASRMKKEWEKALGEWQEMTPY